MSIEFINETYSRQIAALNSFMKECTPLIPGDASKVMRFGGGTALAIYYFQHRKSFDIDLFAIDPQYLAFISPKHWLEDSSLFDNSKYFDRTEHIRLLSIDKIKVDVLVAQDFIDEPFVDDSREIFNSTIYVESIQDIIAKKIVYRAEQNKSKDIIDIAVTISKDEGFIDKLLQKGAINKEDLQKLFDALQRLNLDEFHDEIAIVEPSEEYGDICENAPEIISKNISKNLVKYLSKEVTEAQNVSRGLKL